MISDHSSSVRKAGVLGRCRSSEVLGRSRSESDSSGSSSWSGFLPQKHEQRGFSRERWIFALRVLKMIPGIVSVEQAKEIYDNIECLGGGQDSGDGLSLLAGTRTSVVGIGAENVDHSGAVGGGVDAAGSAAARSRPSLGLVLHADSQKNKELILLISSLKAQLLAQHGSLLKGWVSVLDAAKHGRVDYSLFFKALTSKLDFQPKDIKLLWNEVGLEVQPQSRFCALCNAIVHPARENGLHRLIQI